MGEPKDMCGWGNAWDKENQRKGPKSDQTEPEDMRREERRVGGKGHREWGRKRKKKERGKREKTKRVN